MKKSAAYNPYKQGKWRLWLSLVKESLHQLSNPILIVVFFFFSSIKNKIVSFARTWTELEITSCSVNQFRKTNCFLSHVGSRLKNRNQGHVGKQEGQRLVRVMGKHKQSTGSTLILCKEHVHIQAMELNYLKQPATNCHISVRNPLQNCVKVKM